jgi:hypothetical protein
LIPDVAETPSNASEAYPVSGGVCIFQVDPFQCKMRICGAELPYRQ